MAQSDRADGGDQTHDLSLTKRLLYQLSYIGILVKITPKTAEPTTRLAR